MPVHYAQSPRWVKQNILFLWNKFGFMMEAKGYALRELLRDPDRAFVRIKDDFNDCIGYGYKNRRIEIKFIKGEHLTITAKDGILVEEIDTTLFDEDFSFIVNLKTFGQIPCDI
jgi:hypothetical protein